MSVFLSVCPSVRLFVRLSVCSLLRYSLNVFLPQLPQSRMSHIFRDSESLGKGNGNKVVSDLNIFVWKWSEIATQKKVCCFADFTLQNMVETTLPDGLETFGQRAYR